MRWFVLLLPWLELLTLIQLGIETSALTALLYVLATLVAGIALLRRQGLGVVERLRQSADGSMLGPQMLLDDMAVGFAGLLLIIPGVLTDLAALFALIGPLRRAVKSWFSPQSPQPYSPGRETDGNSVIEGEFTKLDD